MKKILLWSIMMLLPMLASAYDVEIDGIYYNLINGDEAEVTNNSRKYSGSVVIPQSFVYGGKAYSVTSIGQSVFYGCESLTSVAIPNSVTSIGEQAFSGCSGLISIVVNSGNSKYDSRNNCNAIIETSSNTLIVGCKKTTIHNNVTSIGKYAFSSCSGLTSLTIPNSVTSIGNYAFYKCSGLTSLTIPNSVTSIGDSAFDGCSGLTSVIIPNSVTSIGNYTFYKCSGLTSVTIPNRVTSIGQCVFSGCSSLTSLTIPNSVTSIGNYAFYGCSGLTSVTIPNSVTSIGEYAFRYCSGLTSVTIGNSVTSIGQSVFSGCSALASLTIGNSVTSIGNYAFSGCSGLTSLTIPNSVISIGYSAFYGCSGLTSVIIPNSVTSIGSYAFSGCSGLTFVTIPNSMTSIGGSAFDGCSSLISVKSEIQNPFSITDNVFRDISSNAVLQVPKGTKREYEAFSGWTKYFKEIREANDEQSPVTYTLSITAIGNGFATYDGTTIRGRTSTFTLNEGTNATITFTPDNGYRIRTVKVNNSAVSVSNNQYTVSNISRNTSVEVEFEEGVNAFTVNNVNYSVNSSSDRTVIVAKGNYGNLIVWTIPAKVTYKDTEWTVSGIEDGTLANSTDLCAIIWNPEAAFTESVSNPNLLLYVKAASYAPNTIKNVVINGTAETITLKDATSGNNFYCPQEFTAKSISYTHHFTMETGLNESRGWETIALPFDVQKVEHQSKGGVEPFANWKSGDSKKPFWLKQYGNSGWRDANSIKAYTPYIISMPNHTKYKEEYKLVGNVTFSAENVKIRKTEEENLTTSYYNGKTFVPNFNYNKDRSLYALNVINDYASDQGGQIEGSLFTLGLRDIHPFEAYMKNASGTRSIAIADDMTTTGIVDVIEMLDEQNGIRVYDLKGLLIKIEEGKTMNEVKKALPAGIYIVNGQKLIIK